MHRSVYHSRDNRVNVVIKLQLVESSQCGTRPQRYIQRTSRDTKDFIPRLGRVATECLITPLFDNDHQTQDHIMISHDICQLATSHLYQRSPADRTCSSVARQPGSWNAGAHSDSSARSQRSPMLLRSAALRNRQYSQRS